MLKLSNKKSSFREALGLRISKCIINIYTSNYSFLAFAATLLNFNNLSVSIQT